MHFITTKSNQTKGKPRKPNRQNFVDEKELNKPNRCNKIKKTYQTNLPRHNPTSNQNQPTKLDKPKLNLTKLT